MNMNLIEIAKIRLNSQQIAGSGFRTVKDVVGWMGAMQAQDYAMAKWAIGIRLPNSTEQTVEAAIDNGEIIRTHLLRPTWHFVSADDIYWMLELTAPQIRASLRSRHRELELSEKVIAESNTLIEKALTGGKHLTRDELVFLLEKAKIRNENNRAAHVLMLAELDGIICSGAKKAGKQTYALLEERVPRTKSLTKEEALAKLATRYFASRCPATLQDFVWWSGLSVNDAKRALESVKSDFTSETIDSQTYWFMDSFSIPRFRELVFLLPAFDEFVISYKDRGASLPFKNHNKAVSNNGIFRSTIVVNGEVIGIWKRVINKDKVGIEADFFGHIQEATRKLFEKAAMQFGSFLGRKVELIRS